MLAKAANIFGIEEANNFNPFQADLDECSRVEGLLPKPQLLNTNKSKLQLFYLNKRAVNPPQAFKSAIGGAFKASGIVKQTYVLNVIIEPKKLDLNLTADKRKAIVQDEAMLADRLFRNLVRYFTATQEESKICAFKRPREEITPPDKKVLTESALSEARTCRAMPVAPFEVKRICMPITPSTPVAAMPIMFASPAPIRSYIQSTEEEPVLAPITTHSIELSITQESEHTQQESNETIGESLESGDEISYVYMSPTPEPSCSIEDSSMSQETLLTPSKPASQSHATSPSQASKIRLPSPVQVVPESYDIPSKLGWTLEQLRINYIKSDVDPTSIPETMNVFNPECLQSASFESFFNKEKFSSMRVLGQFNLGFIVVNLMDSNEIFLVDQHAADEISQFEMLCETTKLHMQPLVSPIALKLQTHEEHLVSQHLRLFERFGYKLEAREDRPSGERIVVTALAYSRNKLFDVEGVYEAVSQLVENSYVESEDALASLCKPSQFRNVMASRACRSAVMIGTELKSNHMTKIVHHLKDLKRPWNCPHGRPTMLHLSSLSKLLPTKKIAKFRSL
mmetsp:Transcript_3540/g.7533  ORF Transcript_3540/g.7533 Transcript_3540/m.7533 type:complete len:568 (-) Transcript_3540:4198-5901(-)